MAGHMQHLRWTLLALGAAKGINAPAALLPCWANTCAMFTCNALRRIYVLSPWALERS